MASYNISSFMTWFLGQVYSIFASIYDTLDHIYLANNVSLMDFTITIFILGLVISILVAQPGNAMRIEKVAEGKAKTNEIRKEREARARLRRR